MGNICCAKNEDPLVKSKVGFKELKMVYSIDGKKPLGEGAYGKVFKATNTKNKSQKYAIKQIKKTA
jgi:hypothetical protein